MLYNVKTKDRFLRYILIYELIFARVFLRDCHFSRTCLHRSSLRHLSHKCICSLRKRKNFPVTKIHCSRKRYVQITFHRFASCMHFLVLLSEAPSLKQKYVKDRQGLSNCHFDQSKWRHIQLPTRMTCPLVKTRRLKKSYWYIIFIHWYRILTC